MKKLVVLILAAALLTLQNCSKEAPESDSSTAAPNAAADRNSTVTVPAGSHNALAAAVAQAGPSGTIILATGDHTETGTVTIPYSMKLIGEKGAVLRSQTTPSTNNWAAEPQVVEPVLHFKDAMGSSVENIEINTLSASPGNMGILIEDCDRFSIVNCQIKNHQSGIIVVRSSRGLIQNCKVEGSTGWLAGDFTAAYGINMVSGDHNRLIGNETSGCNAGIFGSGKNGLMQKNYSHDNATGIILCTFPKDFFELPGNEKVRAEYSAHAWNVFNNKIQNNFEDGILVIDGANANVLIDNDSRNNNGSYDINLTGDLPDYLWLTFPPSERNLVKSLKYKDVRIKDCGIGNVIIGGSEVDYTVDPCL